MLSERSVFQIKRSVQTVKRPRVAVELLRLDGTHMLGDAQGGSDPLGLLALLASIDGNLNRAAERRSYAIRDPATTVPDDPLPPGFAVDEVLSEVRDELIGGVHVGDGCVALAALLLLRLLTKALIQQILRGLLEVSAILQERDGRPL